MIIRQQLCGGNAGARIPHGFARQGNPCAAQNAQRLGAGQNAGLLLIAGQVYGGAAPFGLGLDYGDNAKAALITRGNAELARLGVAMGCKAETFAGLSGMGDLIVTCTSMHSRNLHAGMLIGRGRDVETAKKEVGQVVEGINALPAACKLAKKYKVEMPIVNAVDDILSGRLAARDALATMMGRQLKQE